MYQVFSRVKLKWLFRVCRLDAKRPEKVSGRKITLGHDRRERVTSIASSKSFIPSSTLDVSLNSVSKRSFPDALYQPVLTRRDQRLTAKKALGGR